MNTPRNIRYDEKTRKKALRKRAGLVTLELIDPPRSQPDALRRRLTMQCTVTAKEADVVASAIRMLLSMRTGGGSPLPPRSKKIRCVQWDPADKEIVPGVFISYRRGDHPHVYITDEKGHVMEWCWSNICRDAATFEAFIRVMAIATLHGPASARKAVKNLKAAADLLYVESRMRSIPVRGSEELDPDVDGS